MAITPNTDLYLLKCPLESDQHNQLTFASRSAQQTYFNGLPKIALDDFSYQRKDSVIRVPYHIDDIIGYNYVMYQNKNYSNRWFYAFITRMEYQSDKCTYVYIKTDVYQTWALDITTKRCFVEREHVNDDTKGTNLVEENLETGEYVQNKYECIPYTVDTGQSVGNYLVCMQVTELPNISAPSGTAKIYNGIASGCWIICFDYDDSGISDMNKVLKWYDSNSKADAVVAIFIAPETIGYWTTNQYTVGSSTVSITFPLKSTSPELMKEYEFTPSTTLNGYTPKNNKVYNYPYNYLYLSNNTGETFEYRFEDFSDYGSSSVNPNNKPRFKVYGALCQGCQIKGIPVNYKKGQGVPVNYASWDYAGWDYGINGAKYPMLSWNSDYYLNWEAQNGQYLATQTGINALTSIAGAAMNPLNIVTGGVAALNVFGQINSALHQQSVAAMVPDQAKGNTSTGDLNFSANEDCFTVRQMCVKADAAKRIDDYFSAYGYQVNAYKIPNFTGRQNWNYVKTIGFNCVGDVPDADIEEYKGLFNAGITLWHNPTTFMDYSQNNNIV